METAEERSRGLMFRKSLPQNQGMLFLFDKSGQHRFWMKNMNFPLDIIWIDQEKRVAQISKNVQPCMDLCEDIISGSKVMFALETNAGFIDKYKINLQDKVKF